MISSLLEYLPRKARPYVVGGLVLATLASAAYAVSVFAAGQVVEPVDRKLEKHLGDHAATAAYRTGLEEAIWSDLRALCAATPNARCDGYLPHPQ
jgi:hypothetical protein